MKHIDLTPVDCQRVEFIASLVRFYGLNEADAAVRWLVWTGDRP